MHWLWGTMLLVERQPVLTTGLAFFSGWAQTARPSTAGLIILLVGTMAACGLGTRWAAYWAIPQQLVLLMSTLTAVHAVLLGQYPDGTIRPSMFILADQLPAILVTVLHTAALMSPPR